MNLQYRWDFFYHWLETMSCVQKNFNIFYKKIIRKKKYSNEGDSSKIKGYIFWNLL